MAISLRVRSLTTSHSRGPLARCVLSLKSFLAFDAASISLASTCCFWRRFFERRPTQDVICAPLVDVDRPHPRLPPRGPLEAGRPNQFVHPRRWMYEGAEWVLRQATLRVFQHDSESHIPDIAWIRQCKTLFCVVECRRQERFIRRIAAHDAVERDQCCRRQLGRNRYKVGMDKTHRVCAAETCCLLARHAVVRRRCIDRDCSN